MAFFKIKKERTIPLVFEYTSLNQFKYTLDIPEGYTLAYMPKPFKVETSDVSFSINYVHRNQQLVYHHSFDIKKTMYSNAALDVWRETYDSLTKQYKQTLILKRL